MDRIIKIHLFTANLLYKVSLVCGSLEMLNISELMTTVVLYRDILYSDGGFKNLGLISESSLRVQRLISA